MADPTELEKRAQSLLASRHANHVAEVGVAWTAEIERRLTVYERGEATLVPADEVFAKASRIIAS